MEYLFIGAFEGGSSYWAELLDETPEGDEGDAPSERWFKHIMSGGSMKVYDLEEEGELLGTITKESMEKGLSKMSQDYPDHYADFLEENHDAITADVFFQLASMNDVVFG